MLHLRIHQRVPLKGMQNVLEPQGGGIASSWSWRKPSTTALNIREVQQTHDALRGLKDTSSGERPGILQESGPQRNDRTVRSSEVDGVSSLATLALAAVADEALDTLLPPEPHSRAGGEDTGGGGRIRNGTESGKSFPRTVFSCVGSVSSTNIGWRVDVAMPSFCFAAELVRSSFCDNTRARERPWSSSFSELVVDGLNETCVDMDRETLFQVISGLCQRGREIETKTLCKH